MKLATMVMGLFLLIGLFLFIWYHIERTAKKLERLYNNEEDQV